MDHVVLPVPIEVAWSNKGVHGIPTGACHPLWQPAAGSVARVEPQDTRIVATHDIRRAITVEIADTDCL